MNANAFTRPSAIRAVLFDFGGVLAELRGEAHLLGLMKNTISREEMWTRWSHSPAVRAHETGKISPEEFAAQIVEELALEVSPKVFLAGFSEWIVGTFPETDALLRDVAARYTTALLTNTCALHRQVIESLNVLPHMHHVFASYQIGRIKPDAAYFEFVLEHMNIAPHDAVFFDDSPHNVAAAQQMGLHAVRVEGAAQVRLELTKLGLLAPH